MESEEIKSLHDLPKKTYLDYIKLFPVAQTKHVRDYTTLLLTLFSVILFGIFAISPTIDTILELRKTLADNEIANQALEEKLVALDSLQTQYNNFGPTLERIENAIPNEPEVPMLLARIQTIAREQGVTISDFNVQKVALDNPPSGRVPASFTFTFSISAPYENTMSFLSSLYDFDRIITVEEVTMEKPSQSLSPLDTLITAKAYYHPEPI